MFSVAQKNFRQIFLRKLFQNFNKNLKMSLGSPGAHTASNLMVTDWKKDVVYLVQFPRAKTNISVSPFAVKVETFLRINKICYKNIDNKGRWSRRGQIPFIEYNGEEINDSRYIIDYLTKQYKIDDQLSTEKKAQARLIEVLADQELTWILFFIRSKDIKSHYFSKNSMGEQLGMAMSLMSPVIAWRMQRAFQDRCMSQGIGRFTEDEVHVIYRKDLTALTDLLGNKQYLFGDKPVTADCFVFCQLVMFRYPPVETSFQKILEEEYKKLCEYVDRIKTNFWPDWSECLEKLTLDTEYTRSIGPNENQ